MSVTFVTSHLIMHALHFSKYLATFWVLGKFHLFGASRVSSHLADPGGIMFIRTPTFSLQSFGMIEPCLGIEWMWQPRKDQPPRRYRLPAV